MNHHWHIYSREQLRQGQTGNAVLALMISAEGLPRIRHRISGTVELGPKAGLSQLVQDLTLLSHPYGMVFEGISLEAARQLAGWTDTLCHGTSLTRFEIHWLNRKIIVEAQKRFVANDRLPADCDALTYCLTRGLTHLLPGLCLALPACSMARGPETEEPDILIVEDEEQQIGMFQIILESLGYERILSARNGEEALPILKERGNHIDLILLNWLMPRMDGMTLLHLLTDEYPHPVGVVMESGYADESHMREFFSAGNEWIVPIDYVAKPFLFDEFKLGVRMAMQTIGRLKRRMAA